MTWQDVLKANVQLDRNRLITKLMQGYETTKELFEAEFNDQFENHLKEMHDELLRQLDDEDLEIINNSFEEDEFNDTPEATKVLNKIDELFDEVEKGRHINISFQGRFALPKNIQERLQ
tara:strand:+ start:210 stop:566 length:357 start_codon:yes stop_codon:yes gene_type:complete